MMCDAGCRTRRAGVAAASMTPLYRARRLLLMADERLDDKGQARSAACSRPAIRKARCATLGTATKSFARSAPSTTPTPCRVRRSPRRRSTRSSRPPRTAASGGRSRSGSHRSQHGTAPTSRAVRLTKAINNLVKRVKFTAFGTNFRNYRIRSLLHAGKPDGALLAITPR